MSNVCVIGLGYVGLPLAVQAASKGFTVTGVDVNRRYVASLNKRKSPFNNDLRFNKAFREVGIEQFVATTDFSKINAADVVIVCVPTPTINNSPDLRYVIAAADAICANLRSGQLICIESTVSPGTTRQIILKRIEDRTNLRVGVDYYLVHCPERIDPGNKQLYVGNINRVIGGITSRCTDVGQEFYAKVIDAQILPLATAEEAEFVKSWENSHRNVMIALANNAAMICDAMDMDIQNVLNGLQSKVNQFGLNLARPGIGPGGHCIPEDIHYVIKEARHNGIDTRLLDEASDLNDRMPRYAVQKLQELINASGESSKNLNVLLLGLSYKPDIDDIRKSPAIEVGYQLVREFKEVMLHDPYYNSGTTPVIGAQLTRDLKKSLKKADAIFVGTAHKLYSESISANLLAQCKVKYVLDGQNCLDKSEIEVADIKYAGIGR